MNATEEERNILKEESGRKKNCKLELESMMPMEDISRPKESRAI